MRKVEQKINIQNIIQNLKIWNLMYWKIKLFAKKSPLKSYSTNIKNNYQININLKIYFLHILFIYLHGKQ